MGVSMYEGECWGFGRCAVRGIMCWVVQCWGFQTLGVVCQGNWVVKCYVEGGAGVLDLRGMRCHHEFNG